MNLQHLRHFTAVADAGSLREAAKLLNLSQSAISKSIKVLEQQMGIQLIDRGSRGSLLTVYGKEVVAHARVVGAEIDNLKSRLREMTGHTGDTLRIGTAAAASMELLPDSISFFRARYPQSEIIVNGGLTLRLLPRLLDGSIDLVIGPQPGGPLPTTVQATPLFTSENVVVVRKGHPLHRAKSFREFSDVKWILTSELSSPDSCLGMARAKLSMPPPTIALQTDEPFLTERLVSSTDYVSILRRCFFQSPLLSARVVPVELGDIDLSDQFSIFTRRAGHTPFLAERFIEALLTHASIQRRGGTKAEHLGA